MIRFDGYHWRFDGTDRWALKDLDLRIGPGELVCLTGPSGAGKSTLAAAAACLLPAGQSAGAVTLAGRDVTGARPRAAAGTVALVRQGPDDNFATLHVADELAFALENRCVPPGQIASRVAEATALMGLSDLRDRPLATLSEGQKQRVAVAAAVAAGPDVLILDEPTANLDPDAAAEVLSAIADAACRKDLTAIVIEQKLAPLAPLRPRVIVLDGGTVAADGAWAGPPAEPAGRAGGRGHPRAVRRRPLVLAEDLTVIRAARTVLDRVSLAVAPGEVVAVMGPNGSGKSTLLLAMMGLVPVAAGRASVCGLDVAATAVHELARRAGLVFQNPDHQLFADSVGSEATFASENFGLPDAPLRAAAAEALASAGLGDRAADHPYRLSHGQKRRLNVISAVLHAPEVLLWDEPGVGQDPANLAWVASRLAERARAGGAAVVVTHNPRLVRRCCDRLVFLDSGRVLLDAPVPEAWAELRRLGRARYAPPEFAVRDASPQAPSTSSGPSGGGT